MAGHSPPPEHSPTYQDAAPLDARPPDAGRVLGGTFNTIIDSGLFHVFDYAARTRYVAALKAILRPGGHLQLMCFSDRQPGDWGPSRFTEAELRAAFGSGWRIVSLAACRFDINPSLGIQRRSEPGVC